MCLALTVAAVAAGGVCDTARSPSDVVPSPRVQANEGTVTEQTRTAADQQATLELAACEAAVPRAVN